MQVHRSSYWRPGLPATGSSSSEACYSCGHDGRRYRGSDPAAPACRAGQIPRLVRGIRGRPGQLRAPGHSQPARPHRRSYTRGPSETLARAVGSLGRTEGAGRAVPAEFAQINCVFPRVVTLVLNTHLRGRSRIIAIAVSRRLARGMSSDIRSSTLARLIVGSGF